MGVVVLVQERLGGLAFKHEHILANRVFGLLVFLHRHQFISVLNAQNLDHLAVQQGQVIDLGSALRKLHYSLILNNPLPHRCSIRVTDGDDFHIFKIFFLDPPALIPVNFVAVFIRTKVTDNTLEKFQFLLERKVNPSLYSRHNFEHPLKDRQRRTDRCLRRHIRDLQISNRRQTSPIFDDTAQKCLQHLTRFFVGQHHNVVPDGTTRHIHIPEFTRPDRRLITLDPQATSLKTAG